LQTIFSQILNRNTWCYYHLKEECLQFHSDLKRIRCAPRVWHGRCPGDTSRKFQNTPTTFGRWGSHFPPTLVYAFPARW
jgi:hypothetical protein